MDELALHDVEENKNAIDELAMCSISARQKVS